MCYYVRVTFLYGLTQGTEIEKLKNVKKQEKNEFVKRRKLLSWE